MAVLMHLGYYNHTITTPHPSMNEVCSPSVAHTELHAMLTLQTCPLKALSPDALMELDSHNSSCKPDDWPSDALSLCCRYG